MLSVKVLGPGCTNCDNVGKVVMEIVSEMALEANVEHVKDRAEFARYGLMYTPGLVLNEKLVCGGRVPSKAEVTSWMMSALEQAG
jgi:small redox-active disulfide protein 2